MKKRSFRNTKRGRLQLKQAKSFDTLVRIDRVTFIMGTFALFASFVIIRLFIIQIMEYDFYKNLASGQQDLVKQLIPDRGEIYAKDPYTDDGIALVVTNRSYSNVYLNPRQVDDPQKTAEAISALLGIDKSIVEERAGKENDLYEPLKNKVDDQTISALESIIEEQELRGIYWTPEEARYYPEGEYAASFTGFVGLSNDTRVGQYGLEQYYNDELTGEVGSVSTKQDPFGRLIATGDNSIIPAQDGETLITTIDKNIQYKTCTLLAAAVEKHQADQGTIIVMNPKTGAILAMCNAPLYDPNSYNEVEDIDIYSNDAVSDQWEPGSVFKSLSMAAALNDKKVTPYTTYEDTGKVEIGPYTIQNSDGSANGVVDMTTVLEKSLNTGSIWVTQQLGNKRWYEYVRAFGFGKVTDIELSGEGVGDISGVAQEKDVYSATSSYGQGLTVTPIQLIQSFTALANDGVMMKPYLVERIVKPNGYQEIFEPEVAGQPITAETARTVSAMLVRVIEGGHAIKAKVPGYRFAGKTGTAQIVGDDGKYSPNEHKDTFVGYGPVSDPELLILVKIDKPKDVKWSADSAAPLFGELTKYLVNYLQIPPDEPFTE